MASGVEVIQDPYSIQQLYSNLVQQAKEEILLFLPTTSAFLREQKIGIIQSLHAAIERGVQVRILTPAEEKISPETERMFHRTDSKIAIRHIRHKSPDTAREARTKILVVDRSEYLIVELKDDSKQTFIDAVRLAIYSSTQSTVKSYLTLFESLWEQAELYDQLEAHDRMQKEFINVAAHELRTPIQPILGMIEILELEFNKAADGELRISKDQLDLIVRNAGRLEHLATAILEVSRIESNTLKLNKEKFDINEKIRNVVEEIKKTREFSKAIEFQYKIDKQIIVEADKVRIFEVLSNLLRNAIKFTTEGNISVKAELKGINVQIDVSDSGEGIDPEIMPKLFSKFATKSDQGTGLGLFISKNIVEAHGGKIWARNNKDGKGATFSFTLPLA